MDCTTTVFDRHYTGESFPVDPGDRIILGSVMTVVRPMQLPTNAAAGNGGTWPYPPVVQHPVMQALYSEAREVASSPSTRACVLLLGETGVGKDEMARAMHAGSPRAKGPFVPVNCPGFTEAVFDSAMFGHLKGAFTGAIKTTKGYFEAADGGTLFLDEIGELSLTLQAKLLKAIDERQITRVGDTEPKSVNVRIIAATNRDLQQCVAQGTFRRDLYYRLRGFELEIPPLRSRPADIIPLAEAFLADECKPFAPMPVPRLSKEAIAILQGYEFPGNVRDLRNAMMYAVVHCRGNWILSEHLPPELYEDATPRAGTKHDAAQAPAELSEKERLIRALYDAAGCRTRAAEILGISRRTLYKWLDKYPEIPQTRKPKDS